jgi:tetratricopeptide (TPR) repeat protein
LASSKEGDMTAGRLLYAARKAERNGNKAKAEEIYTRLVKDFPESEEAISAKMDLLVINPIIANEVLASEETCKISSDQENSDPMSNRDVGTLILHDYIMNSDGISRKELNIYCFLGLFIFGFLFRIVFDSLGKKVLGWLYFLSIILLILISIFSEYNLNFLAILLYIGGWGHANLILSQYQNFARKRVMLLKNKPQTVDLILEKGILYHKVLDNSKAALSAFSKMANYPDNGSAILLNLAGVALLDERKPKNAITFFDRALAAEPNDQLIEHIRKNLEVAKKAVAKK